MSTGARIPLARAAAAAKVLMQAWKMPAALCTVVGSIRRCRPEVGDIEILAPNPGEGGHDTLFEAIEDTRFEPNASQLMFGAPAQATASRFTLALRGLKRGFWSASLVVRLRVLEEQETTDIPCQIFRYDDGQLGWDLLRTTGPSAFNVWFLGQWKWAWSIPAEQQASIDGRLVDRWGKPVSVPTEHDAFRLARIGYIAPEFRDRYVEDMDRSRARVHRERMR